jgi:hypothetical protein
MTLDRRDPMAKVQTVQVPQRLPVVLSRDEVARLIEAAPNLKSQTALFIAYATGLRVSEVVGLKVTDIDSKRMTLRVEQGKGRKDRYAMLPPVLLERLRGWWRPAHAQGKTRRALGVCSPATLRGATGDDLTQTFAGQLALGQKSLFLASVPMLCERMRAQGYAQASLMASMRLVKDLKSATALPSVIVGQGQPVWPA